MLHQPQQIQMVVEPDDGQGHGTHVAGSALGTGDSSRVHRGTAPGAYLVDIKVLTDAGGTNSQYSISGIQWMINNADTDWGTILRVEEFRQDPCLWFELLA